jgi:purine-nucleoside/S-methyl-5'-thioadenosine phosphorylase / adenosine deaminase
MDGFERRGEPDAPRWIVAAGLESRGVLAAFTGVKDGDDPGAVCANREAVRAALDLRGFATAEQIHGARVADVTSDAGGRPLEGCDALTSGSPGMALAILTADCVPVALADDHRVAAVHVGWRGAASGVLVAALGRFADPETISAAVGPAIRACHYQVGEEVVRAVGDGLQTDPVTERREGSWYLDLPGTVAASLRRAGLADVAECGLCTACEADRFFSFRRDGRTGRQALVVVRR